MRAGLVLRMLSHRPGAGQLSQICVGQNEPVIMP